MDERVRIPFAIDIGYETESGSSIAKCSTVDVIDTNALCHIWCETLKNSHWSMAIGSKSKSTSAALDGNISVSVLVKHFREGRTKVSEV